MFCRLYTITACDCDGQNELPYQYRALYITFPIKTLISFRLYTLNAHLKHFCTETLKLLCLVRAHKNCPPQKLVNFVVATSQTLTNEEAQLWSYVRSL